MLTIPERHYSYECKATAQERPYVSRPSRSQQFRNPKLVPKLTNETLNPLEQKKGVADEELAKLEAERARERKREQRDDGLIEPNVKRPGSVSSRSVSTISTGASRSPSLGKDRARSPAQSPRSRSPYSDDSQHGRRDDSRSRSRNHSPSLNRSRSPRVEARHRRSDSGRSPSPEDFDHHDQYRSRDPLPSAKGSAPPRHPRQYPSKSRSPHSLRHRRSGSPRSPQPRGRHDQRPDRSRTRHDRERLPPRARFDDRRQGHGGPDPGDHARERSLSPFSQRLAMTQAMKGGR